jgi:hypothetical protein
MTDWPRVHEKVIETFSAGWDKPDPHGWDDFLAEDVELNQPMLRPARGRAAWWDEARRLLEFLPDLRGDVLSWSGREDVVFIELELSGTAGGKRLAFRAVDKLWITPDAAAVRRDSFFDSAPLAREVLRRPGAWLPWWRSGLGPFLARRRFVGRR